MPGPLPKPEGERARVNKPTIPTTSLPAGGRRGRAPNVPDWVSLGKAGLGWWAWAWRTPQACGWSIGDRPLIARRAALEDDLASVQGIDFEDWLEDVGNAESNAEIKAIVHRLSSLVTGRLSIYREQREIDDRLGLTPKGLAQLRWKIVADEVHYPPTATTRARTAENSGKVTAINSRRSRLAEQG